MLTNRLTRINQDEPPAMNKPIFKHGPPYGKTMRQRTTRPLISFHPEAPDEN